MPDGTDFHSFRRTFLTVMEHKALDYVAVARFAGHQVPTLTHAVYSSGAIREAFFKAADAARYAPEVERRSRQRRRSPQWNHRADFIHCFAIPTQLTVRMPWPMLVSCRVR